MYPLILAHGFLGYRKFLLWSMFDGVVDALQQQGFRALQPVVHPTASIEERSRQWIESIDREIGADTPFHWIGHSMGGLDGRYIASPGGLNLGYRFRTLTTISTPHQGSSIAAGTPRFLRPVFSWTAYLTRYLFSGEQRQFLEQLSERRWEGLDELTPDSMQSQFNPQIVDHPQVRYYSFAGKVDYSQVTLRNLFRQPAWRYMYRCEGDNDGMVSVRSSQWGEFKEVLPCDHGEEVGLRVIPWIPQKFDYVGFFVQLARELERIDIPLVV